MTLVDVGGEEGARALIALPYRPCRLPARRRGLHVGATWQGSGATKGRQEGRRVEGRPEGEAARTTTSRPLRTIFGESQLDCGLEAARISGWTIAGGEPTQASVYATPSR